MARPIDLDQLMKYPLRRGSEHCDEKNADPRFLNGVESILEWAQTLPTLTPPNEWVSVEERLPDKPGHYLVCTSVNYWHGGCMNKNGVSSNKGTTDGYVGTTLSVLDCFYDTTGNWNRVYNKHVTHWMPLPAPPTKEG